MKPTLFLLAAGMGSRYGGLKQLDGLGPNGETIMDYSIYDAINAGFGKLVFVIRKDFEQDFREKIISKYEGHIPCELVFQALDNLPEGFTCPAERTKPWGTNHAVMMGADVIQEPFAVINCDDFYGRDSFQVMGKFLSALPEGAKNTVPVEPAELHQPAGHGLQRYLGGTAGKLQPHWHRVLCAVHLPYLGRRLLPVHQVLPH